MINDQAVSPEDRKKYSKMVRENSEKILEPLKFAPISEEIDESKLNDPSPSNHRNIKKG
jgi:hypothetical protein